MTRPRSRALDDLAALCGVLTEYQDWKHKRRQASPAALHAVFHALGFDTSAPDWVDAALRAERARRWRRLLAPCAVAWDGIGVLDLGAAASARGRFAGVVRSEAGQEHALEGRLDSLPVTAAVGIDGAVWLRRNLLLPALEPGYHRVTLELDDAVAEGLVISSPTRAWGAPGSAPPSWGLFTPAYALRSTSDLGSGGLAELTRLGEWVAERGGGVVGTLPMLAAYLDEPYEASPYSPVSKLFWNELYLDLRQLLGASDETLARSGDEWGQALLDDPVVSAEVAALRDTPRVAYRRQMALKRRLLEPMAVRAWSEQRAALEAYVASRPRVEDYARFRAAVERDRRLWTEWPEAQRDGTLTPADYDESACRYHIYVQYLMQRQLAGFRSAGATPGTSERRDGAAALYLDLPIGVNRYGYDVWRERDVFALGMSAGAPPDALFSGGQNWGFPPLHPRRLRERGYDYLIECLKSHLEQAAMLRIDHVMGFHRLYWVPEGMPATEGVYVRYPAEELYAVHVLESHRQQCALVGEDLGTVPDQVPAAMERHGLHRLFVVQFSLPGADGEDMAEPPAETVASLNTHDMPTFSGFWAGQEIDDRVELGLLDEDEALAEWQGRLELRRATMAWLRREGLLPDSDPAIYSETTARLAADQILGAVMRGCTYRMAASPAQVVLITLDDLWLESVPQNVPGTGWERPNWRRRSRFTLEEIFADPEISEVLARVDGLRRKAGRPSAPDSEPEPEPEPGAD